MTDYPRFPIVKHGIDSAYQQFHGARAVELVLTLVDLFRTQWPTPCVATRQVGWRHAVRVGAAAMSVALVLMLVAAAIAQEVVRIRGTIERIDGDGYIVKARDGSRLRLAFDTKASIAASVKCSPGDIRPGLYIGVMAVPNLDGTLRAIEAHIFDESMRGTAEGHRAWDLLPESTMTNAVVEDVVSDVDGQMTTLRHKDGQHRILIPPGITIAAYLPGSVSELKPGATVFIPAASRQSNGTFLASRVMVGRNIPPPQ